MGHEIYYTSAPEGIRPGESGFCTVAATAGIPPALWKRLESLGAYRHQFETGSGVRNPVAHAHWIVQLSGKDYHVLSRIGDCGVDYSGRPNMLAHHLLLDDREMARAGPAWMLVQPGVMLGEWDGRVRTLARTYDLPSGDIQPAVCAAWKGALGDAGWAGFLAEAVFRNPAKPVCIQFGPQQDVLPLIGEAIALLPAELRWQVTFNTYFTSLPGNAACAWRCCLAGTAAAATAARYAAGGVSIDLTVSPDRWSAPPEGPWVTLARTGEGDVGKLTSTTTTSVRLRPIATGPRRKLRRPGESAEPYALEEETETFDFDLSDLAPPAPKPTAPSENSASTSAVQGRPDLSWLASRRKARSRRMIAIYLLALLALGGGLWIMTWVRRASSEVELPKLPPAPPPTEVIKKTDPIVLPDIAPAPRNRVVPTPAPPTVNIPEPRLPRPPVVRPGPKLIRLAAALQPAAAGNGLRDLSQIIAVPASEFDDLKNANALRLVFPGNAGEFAVKRSDLAGSYSVQPGPPLELSVALRWRESMSIADPVELATIRLDKSDPRLEITWRTREVLKQPKVVALAFWLLHNCTFVVADPNDRRPQRIEPKPLEFAGMSLMRAEQSVNLPAEASGDLGIKAARELPKGWQVSFSRPAPEKAGDAVPPQAPCVLSFRRPAAAGVPKDVIVPQFVLRFVPGRSVVECDLSQRLSADQAELAKWTAERQRVDGELGTMDDISRRIQKKLRDDSLKAQTLSRLPPDELKKRGMSEDELKRQIVSLDAALKKELTDAAKARQPVLDKRKACDEYCRLDAAAIAAYGEMSILDVAIESPEGLRIALLHFEADGATTKPTTGELTR